ncbi:MAG: DnaD domain protein [Erysipelotrichales bacterium]|nr:MAG: DnaD domain protein [Erysipelotrichales bacterium]
MKNKFWQEPYFDRIAWILENIEHIDLTSIEALVVLQLEHMRKNNLAIDLEMLAKRCKVESAAIDMILASLTQKGYMTLEVKRSEVCYALDGLYQAPQIVTIDADTVFKLFEQEFGRPLSSVEIDKLVDWISLTSADICIHALREAVMYRKLNFNYIDKILSNWIQSGVTLDQLDQGRSGNDGNR